MKIWIISLLLCLMLCISAFAAGKGKEKPAAFPFEIELDLEECDRLCYAGHPEHTVQYRDGLAATPDTSFQVRSVSGGPEVDVNHLSMEIAIIYENENQTGSYKETIRRFEPGDLNLKDSYSLFSENTIQSLNERGKLYSDSLKGVEITMNYDFRQNRKKQQYLYICSDEDYDAYLENMAQNYDDSED